MLDFAIEWLLPWAIVACILACHFLWRLASHRT